MITVRSGQPVAPRSFPLLPEDAIAFGVGGDRGVVESLMSIGDAIRHRISRLQHQRDDVYRAASLEGSSEAGAPRRGS